MKQKLSTTLSSLLWGSVLTCLPLSAQEAASPDSPQDELRLFPYHALASLGDEIQSEFKRTGYIAISGVPGFQAAYEQFLEQARRFVALPAEVQAKCTPSDYFARGWSRGVEALVPGQKDTYKGSYYAWVPNQTSHPNVWPAEVPGLEPAYRAITEKMLAVGKEVLTILGVRQDSRGLGRMLHYKAIPEGENDGNPNWCNIHRDHGALTVLCPEVYYKNGERVSRPEGGGLYIEGKPVSPPTDIMLIQMGEVLELISNGAVRATDHYVGKPAVCDGCERFALALFLDPIGDFVIRCTNPEVRAKYADRFPLSEDSITYEEWGNRSLAKYNPKSLAPKQ